MPNFVRPEMFDGVVKDFPTIKLPSLIPPSEPEITGQFAQRLKEMNGFEFQPAIEK